MQTRIAILPVACGLSLCVAGVLLPLAGCKEEATPVAPPAGAAAGAAATNADPLKDARSALDGYVTELKNVVASLEKIKTGGDVPPALPTLSVQAGKLNGHAQKLTSLTSAQRATVIGPRNAEVAALESDFRRQADRLSKDPLLSRMMGDSLTKFTLVQ